uniref:CSON006025 protein n=1 Tax=Culicoides sonorensis TaxID=179676 RepID=A0A336LIP7_CULSO
MYNVRNMQTMSSNPLRSDVMLDSLTHQLREAESRRAEAERAHQDALTQLRSMSSSGIGRMSEPIETMQSRARELEKKVGAALETVKCEELQLELSAARAKAKSGSGVSSQMNRMGTSTIGGTITGSSYSSAMATATGYNSSSADRVINSSGVGGGGGGGSTVTWAPTPTQHPQQGSEIDRIMAKIEQACHFL